MVDRPWESEDDRKAAEKRVRDTANADGCVLYLFGGVIALVIVLVALYVLGAF